MRSTQNSDLAQRIFPTGYFSLWTGLSLNGMIGTKNPSKVEMITTHSRPKSFSTDLGEIQMKVIDADYFFGFSNKEGLNIATPEKCIIDTCYYYYRINNYGFDISSDIITVGLELKTLSKMLNCYKNKKVVSFAKGTLENYGLKIR